VRAVERTDSESSSDDIKWVWHDGKVGKAGILTRSMRMTGRESLS